MPSNEFFVNLIKCYGQAWDTYHFIRIDEAWKILGDTVYDE